MSPVKTVTYVSSLLSQILRLLFQHKFFTCLITFLFLHLIYMIFLAVKFWDTLPEILRPLTNHHSLLL